MCIQYAVFTNIAITCPIISLLYYHCLYSLCSDFIPVTYSFRNWQPVSPSCFLPFCLTPQLLFSSNHQFVLYIYSSDSVFCLCIFFRFHLSGIIWYFYYILSLTSFTLHNTLYVHRVTLNGMISSFFMTV